MEGVVGDRILRCSDGHYFISSESKRLLGSLHLGPSRFVRCPVDGKWRMAGNANSADLSEEELEQARSHRV